MSFEYRAAIKGLFESEPSDSSPPLAYTGERIIPGSVSEALFRDHESRYVFAGRYVAGKDVLDVACGTGMGTAYLLSAGARSCTGVDIDKEAIHYARGMYKGCKFAQADAANLSLPDSSVDVVVSFETIEHIADQSSFLMNCKRVLRPGGVFICSTPNRTLSRWGEKNPFHFRELTLVEFREMIVSAFGGVQLYSQKNRIYPLYVCRKLLAKALDRLQLAEPIQRFRRGATTVVAPKAEFVGRPRDSGGKIHACRAPLLLQPTFLIAVARNALR